MTVDPATRQRIEHWIGIDAEHGEAIAGLLVDEPDRAVALFDGRIAFGTAGLRAEMGPGPKAMNRLVVRQATAGLMDWLTAASAAPASGPLVVVGYDARHHSQRFAHDVAAVVLARGGRVELIDRPAPTPVLARAVLDRQADAGIMITASHNPAADNGYKLYLGDGIQLVSPADAEIAAAIDRVADTDPLAGTDLPAGSGGEGGDGPPAAATDIADEALARHRQVAIEALATDHRQVSIVYTAMHGVGGRHLLDCFEAAGFPAPVVVEAQFDPDPDFPTAAFPNPEEAGALDLALAQAAAGGADGPFDIVLANDPDADRLAVAVPDRDGVWARLSGDQVGALLADHLLTQASSAAESDQGSGSGTGTGIVASSIVSSRFIDALAAANGAESIRTLTGFKWVARPIVERPEARYLFGYEEALGYCVGDRVRDKDGVSAALVMAELVARCRAEGQTLLDRLDDLACRHGLYATRQVTVRLDELEPAERDRLMARAVALEPADVGGVAVTAREDLSQGATLPPTAGIVLDLADGARVIVRPSGTEPKVKAYLEVIETAVTRDRIDQARDATNRRLDALAAAVETLLTGG